MGRARLHANADALRREGVPAFMFMNELASPFIRT
jgi:hypothetical protein